MTIPTYRLPEGIERGSRYGPAFHYIVQEAISGNEQRFGQWSQCRGVGDLSYGLLNSTDPVGDFQAILALYRAHTCIYPFRFRDWGDYTATDENFGTGAGVETQFQLTRTYDPSQILLNTPGSLTVVRDITLLDGTPVIKIAGTPTVAFSISDRGLVTFDAAPTGALTWTGEFDNLVRFDTPTLPIILNESNIAALGSTPIKEVVGE